MLKLAKLFVIVVVICSLVAGGVPSGAAGRRAAYVEPGLLASQATTLDVIVTGAQAGAAAQAVARAGGRVTGDLWLIDAVAAEIPARQLASLAADARVLSIVDNKGVQGAYTPSGSGSDWLTGLSSAMVTDQAWPVSVDVGADQVHASGITGKGVTVAVVDSGVFFAANLILDESQQILINFWGQADFVGEGLCDQGAPWYEQKQYSDHCYRTPLDSKDAFGHGTHIAGIVGNKYRDAGSGVYLGLAPHASVLSVRVLDDHGVGTYADVIQGIQYVVANRQFFKIRVLNLSLSAEATTPYFVDPLNRAAEAAWAAGIVVVAAAGNAGPGAESITVPGNDPYVITVGAIDTRRTPGDWSDDIVPVWSSTGPTLDGFVKPDVLAPGGNLVSYMYNNAADPANTAKLALSHPDYSETMSLFRMNGTSMATALTSGVIALMLEANPNLTPDQVKYRLMATARPALTGEGDLVYNVFQQGMGRIWAPDAVGYGGLVDADGKPLPDGRANLGMDIHADLAHGWASEAELAYHYQGPVRRALSDDGSLYLYYVVDQEEGAPYALGIADAARMIWSGGMIWSGDLPAAARMIWSGALTEVGVDSSRMIWAGGLSYPAGMIWSNAAPGAAGMIWAGGMIWTGNLPSDADIIWSGRMIWSGALTQAGMVWSGGMIWSGRMIWAGGMIWAGDFSPARMIWAGAAETASASAPPWVDEAEPAPVTLRVSDLDGESIIAGDRWRAGVQVTVTTLDGAPVQDATVTLDGYLGNTLAGTLQCVTDLAGVCTVVSARIKARHASITVVVAEVAHASFAYDPANNFDLDGDSDGASIVVYNPWQ